MEKTKQPAIKNVRVDTATLRKLRIEAAKRNTSMGEVIKEALKLLAKAV